MTKQITTLEEKKRKLRWLKVDLKEANCYFEYPEQFEGVYTPECNTFEKYTALEREIKALEEEIEREETIYGKVV